MKYEYTDEADKLTAEVARLEDDYQYQQSAIPFLDARFIAINEQYDSKTANATLGVDIAMKNIIYYLYIRDLSKKVRSARKSLMKNRRKSGSL